MYSSVTPRPKPPHPALSPEAGERESQVFALSTKPRARELGFTLSTKPRARELGFTLSPASGERGRVRGCCLPASTSTSIQELHAFIHFVAVFGFGFRASAPLRRLR